MLLQDEIVRAWAQNETYPDHSFYFIPLDVSQHSRNLCVDGVGPFEHETPFYLEPSSARIRALGYLKCILVRSDLKAAAVEGQLPLVLFDNLIGSGVRVRHLISFHYARVPTLHVWVRSELEDTVLFALDDRVSKRLGVVPCGCVRMKVSPLGPEFTYLAIRRHTRQITYIRLDRWAGLGGFHIGSCGRQTFMSNY